LNKTLLGLPRKILDFSFIFSPDGTFKMLWDILCMFLIFYEILIIPFQISFDVTLSAEFELFGDLVFLADILLNFNTGFYKNGILV
jgi:hyperpolarization activated cyclic nucleotide-gated potassium channel 2